jgi:hypothetical protein
VSNNLPKRLHFLSGLPRSGSTVLAAILNQNPQTHVSTTSGLGAALDALATAWHKERLLDENDKPRTKLAKAMRGVIAGYYDEVTTKPVVIDKARAWPMPIIVGAMEQVFGVKPRIIATVRSVPDCMASFVRVAKPIDLDEFVHKSGPAAHLKTSYQVLQTGYAANPDCFLFVEYEDLLANPKREVERIHKFLELPPFDYDFNNIDGSTVKEDDENLHGIVGLHDIKPKLGRQHNQSPKDVLKHHYSQFCQPEFWLPEPRTKPEVDDLDLQLAASTMGDFKEGRRIADKLAIERPNDDRAAFNRGWYELHDGNFRLGHQLLYRGRKVGVFGNSPPNTPQPEWNGKPCATLLMYLEGGLGDQIQQLGYIRHVRQTGVADIIISCSPELVRFVNNANLCSAVVQHGAEYGIYHDCWMAAMSAPVYMNLSKEMIYGVPYLDKIPDLYYSKKLRVGLRWSGNKQFEAQHHKLFPAPLFFDAVKRNNVEFISLQRDADLEYKPDWVQTVPLDTWGDTQAAVSTCDLVISSCTSVSHLSAAMGVPTWVVIPVMGYYLYAEPGPKTPYYNSMRLFRQQKYGDWTHPFEEIKALNYEHELLSGRE